jgi:hypothetical protein
MTRSLEEFEAALASPTPKPRADPDVLGEEIALRDRYRDVLAGPVAPVAPRPDPEDPPNLVLMDFTRGCREMTEADL